MEDIEEKISRGKLFWEYRSPLITLALSMIAFPIGIFYSVNGYLLITLFMPVFKTFMIAVVYFFSYILSMFLVDAYTDNITLFHELFMSVVVLEYINAWSGINASFYAITMNIEAVKDTHDYLPSSYFRLPYKPWLGLIMTLLAPGTSHMYAMENNSFPSFNFFLQVLGVALLFSEFPVYNRYGRNILIFNYILGFIWFLYDLRFRD